MDTALAPKALFSIHLENRKHHKFTDLLDSNTGKRMTMDMKSNSFMFSHIFHCYSFYICSQKCIQCSATAQLTLFPLNTRVLKTFPKGFSSRSTGLVRYITYNQQMVQRRQQPLKDSGDLLRVMEDGQKFEEKKKKKILLKMFLLSLNI